MSENANVDLESLKYSNPNSVNPDRPRPYHDYSNLYVLYHQLHWNQSEIADYYDVNQSTISLAMEEAGIESRPPADKRQQRGDC